MTLECHCAEANGPELCRKDILSTRTWGTSVLSTELIFYRLGVSLDSHAVLAGGMHSPFLSRHSYLGTLPAAVGGGKIVHFVHSVSLET